MKINFRSNLVLFSLFSILFFVFFILQTSNIMQLKIFGVVPNFTISLIILIAIFENIKVSFFFALINGLILDLHSIVFGFNSVFFIIMAVLVSVLFKKNITINYIFIILSNIVFELFYFILEFILSNVEDLSLINVFLRNSLIKIVISTFVISLLYLLFKKISDKKRFTYLKG